MLADERRGAASGTGPGSSRKGDEMAKMTLALTVALLAAAGNQGGDARKDENILGRWYRSSPPVTADRQGLTGDGADNYGFFIVGVNIWKTMTIQGDRLVFLSGPENATEVRITLDPFQFPRTIDAKTAKGEVVFRGIYETNGISLRLCISGKDRPRAFVNTPKTPLIEFKR
jgi:uncharacterized protein (TIGR03067 family)